MALSVYPQESSKNLKSKSPPPQMIPDSSKTRVRGNSAAMRPSLRLHIANPTERLPAADTQTRALYNVPTEPIPPLPAELRHRGASFGTAKRSPSPQIRVTNTASGNSTPSSSSAGSATSGRGTTHPGRHQVVPQQMHSAGTVTTAITDELSGFSAFPSNSSTPATNESAHSFTVGPGNKNRSRPLPLPPPTSRPPSRGSSTPDIRHGKGNSGAHAQQLTFDPTTSTWTVKPPAVSSPLRSAPASKLTANATSPQLLGAGYPHGYHQQSHLQHRTVSRSHGHSRSRSDQSREVASQPKPLTTGSDSSDVSRSGKSRNRQQSVRTAPNSDNESEVHASAGSKWKGKQPAEMRHDSNSPVETEEEPEVDPERLPGGKKWKGKEPIRGEGWHLIFPNASKNSSGLSLHTAATDVSAGATPPPMPATAPLPSTIVSGIAASSSSSLDLQPSISKHTALGSASSFGPAAGRPQSISSISISSRESREEVTTPSRWKSKGRDGIRRSGSISSVSSYNSISGVSAGISKKSSKKGKGKSKNVGGSASISYHGSAYGGPNANLGATLTSPYIPAASTPQSASTTAAVVSTPTPVTVVPLPSAAPTPRSTQTLHQHRVGLIPERTFTPSRNLPAEPVASSGTPPLPIPPSLQVGGGIQAQVQPKSPPVPLKDSTQARAMANDPFTLSYNPSPDNTDTNPHLLYVYREYRDPDSDSLPGSQPDPVDIGYGYGEVGFEDDERVYVDDGYSGPQADRDDWNEEDTDGGFITAAGTYVESGTGSNSDLVSTTHSSIYHGSTVHGSNIAHSVRNGITSGKATVDATEFRAPSPMSFARRRKNSLVYSDDEDEFEDAEDDDLSPVGVVGGAGYDMQSFGNTTIPVAAPVPRRPGVSVAVMEQSELANAGFSQDWRAQVQPTVPALPSSGTGARLDTLSPASPRGARQRPTPKGSSPDTPSAGLAVDINPADILGPEDEMIFSKNPSPTRYGGGYRSPFTFGGDERVFVRGRWRLRSPSPTVSPLDSAPGGNVSGHGLSPASGGSAPLSPITFTSSSASNTLSPLSGPNSPIRRQRTGANLGANLGTTARKLRRYASEESLLIENPNPTTAYSKASYNNFNNSNYDSSYYNNYNHSAAPMRLAPNRYVEPNPRPKEQEAKPRKSNVDEYEAMGTSWSGGMERNGTTRRSDRNAQSGNGSGSDSGSIGGRKRGTTVPKITQSNHGQPQVLTKSRRPQPMEKVSYDLWVQGLESKGKRV